jgi:hypothetical protein
MGFLFTFFRFLISVGTCATFLPSLFLILERRRHFELFVGSFQLMSAVAYSAGDALGTERMLLVSVGDWHQVSDIMTSTYLCLLGIHLLGLRSEDTLHALRYAAFGLSWVAKLADGWGNVAFEAAVYAAFLVPPTALVFQRFVSGFLVPIWPPPGPPARLAAFLDRKLAYDTAVAPKIALGALAGCVLFGLELFMDTELRVCNALAKCAFGGVAYYAWRFLPCYDKAEEIPMFR